jgi:phosphonopyruvate decarboxylase
MTPQSRALFSSTGLISRSLFHHSDSPNQFYNAGALGLTSALGLGFAVAQPETPVTVVEGDGSVLTDLGNLNLIGHQQPKHFLHILLDDGSYTSCSGEPTVGSELIPDLASVFGYSHIFSIASTDVLQTIINDVNNSRLPGPIMIHMRINKEGGRNFNRPLGMAEIAARFRKHFQLK